MNINNTSDFVISNKILFPNACSISPIANNQENSHSSYLITPAELRYADSNTRKSAKTFIKNRNISKIHYFSKVSFKKTANSAPSLTVFSETAPGNQSLKNPQNSSKSSENSEIFCKICFESEATPKTGRLISPCKCAGSVQFIHEECLKTWIISQKMDLSFANCELCHKFYKMDIKFGLKFLPKAAFSEGIQNVLAMLCLFVFFACLIVIIVLFSIQWNLGEDLENSENSDNSSYKIAILSSCSVIACVVLVLIYFTGKETCFVPFIKKWTIQDSKKKRDRSRNKSSKTAKIDKKKVAPLQSFTLRREKNQKNAIAEKLQTKVQNFFERKAFSDNLLLRNCKNRGEKPVKSIKTTILKVSSTKKLILIENLSKLREKPAKLPSLSQEKSSLSQLYCENIPKDFVTQDHEAEKLLEVLVETRK